MTTMRSVVKNRIRRWLEFVNSLSNAFLSYRSEETCIDDVKAPIAGAQQVSDIALTLAVLNAIESRLEPEDMSARADRLGTIC